MSGRLFCFGLGYSARALARRLAPEGFTVGGTSRDGRIVDGIATAALETADLAGATHALASIPPDDEGDPAFRRFGAALDGVRWFGYLSTTGIYGDHGGAEIDETTAPAPLTDRAKRRLQAEEQWLGLWRDRGVPVHVFRLAGIYGPRRNVIDDLRRGTARRVVKPGQVFSRIHVEDIAAVLEASIARPDPGAVYNVADDEPAASEAVLLHAAMLLGVEPPAPIPWDDPSLSAMARSFYTESRRVSNRRIREELGVVLAYPTYREGLAAIASTV